MAARIDTCLRFLLAVILLTPANTVNAESLEARLQTIDSRWASIYGEPNKRSQTRAMKTLLQDVRSMHGGNPKDAAVAAWHGIVARSYLDMGGSPRIAREARDAFLQAESLDALVFGGLVYANLGALYTDASSKFGGFGNKTRGLGYFWKALVVDPDGVESNYLYAKMLASEKDYHAAHDALLRANTSVSHPLEANVDRARRHSVSDLLEELTPQL